MKRKELLFKYFTALLVASLLLPAAAFAKKEYTKTIRKEFMTQADGVVELRNKHGDIEITTWDENRVAIKVVITVDACSEEDAQKVFDRIHIDFANQSRYISAATEIGDQSKNWWKSLKGCDASYSIDYLVSMPASNNLIVENKYGDIYIDELDREAEVVLSYGNLRMEGVGETLQLEFSYGNGFIVEAGKNLQAEINYGKAKITEVGVARIQSKYSTIEIESCQKLESETKYDRYYVGEAESFTNSGKYDNFQLGEVQEVRIETEYTDLKINELYKAMNATMKYGGARIGSLEPGFSRLDLQGKYTNYKVYAASGTEYRLEADGKYAGISVPQAVQVTRDVHEGSEKRIQGHTARGQGAGVIHANLSYGSLKIND